MNYRKQEGSVKVVVIPNMTKTGTDESVIDSEMSDLSNVSSIRGSDTKWNVGRPVGTTAEKKQADENKTIKARNEAAKIYDSAKKFAKENGKRVRKGELNDIIKEVAKKNNVNVENISPLAIRCRVDRQSLECHHLAGGGQVSPLAEIEPIVVGINLQMARIR